MSVVRVLIISHDVIDASMAGPGIRYWELARVLAGHCAVTLAVPGQTSLRSEGFHLHPYRRNDWHSIETVAETSDVILPGGTILTDFPQLARLGRPLVVDGYDPYPAENLPLASSATGREPGDWRRNLLDRLRQECSNGDFFLCASERQRYWWLGLLAAHGRLNPATYHADPTFRNLIDIVPFGLDPEPLQHTHQTLKGVIPGIAPDDAILLWGGGIWEWLDPLTLLRALPLVIARRPNVRLVFPGTRHPSPLVPDMPMRQRAVDLAAEQGLLGKHVFFGDWVPYADWPNYLLEADVGVSLHLTSLETQLAFRSRVMDYIRAGLPMVVTGGDATSDIVRDHGLGLVVDYGDEAGIAEAILVLLGQARSAWQDRFSQVRPMFTWERVAQPLIQFCANPHRAADRRPIAAEPDRQLLAPDDLRRQVQTASWYHTLDLGNGIITPGAYDLGPYLHYYGLPDDLTGKSTLDIGTASGFFAFEMERRGAKVTAIDLPAWFDHDFGPRYVPDLTADEGLRYLQEPFMLAKQALGSRVEKLEMSIYDISPQTVGTYDLVFCGSLLLHLTDPIQALRRIRSVTREQAIIATAIVPDAGDEPVAHFRGHQRGDAWWLPNRAGLEALVCSAGFEAWEWISEFRLDPRDGQPGLCHGVIRAWPVREGHPQPAVHAALDATDKAPDLIAELRQAFAWSEAELLRLQALVAGYERGRFIRLMRWLKERTRPQSAVVRPDRTPRQGADQAKAGLEEPADKPAPNLVAREILAAAGLGHLCDTILHLDEAMRDELEGFNTWACMRPESYASKEVLDLGCGLGAASVLFVARGAAFVWGIDPVLTEKQIEALGSLPRSRFTAGLLSQIDFGAQRFDLVYARLVTEHLIDLQSDLARIFTLLKPGGRFVALHDNYYSPMGQHDHAFFGAADGAYNTYRSKAVPCWQAPNLCEASAGFRAMVEREYDWSIKDWVLTPENCSACPYYRRARLWGHLLHQESFNDLYAGPFFKTDSSGGLNKVTPFQLRQLLIEAGFAVTTWSARLITNEPPAELLRLFSRSDLQTATILLAADKPTNSTAE